MSLVNVYLATFILLLKYRSWSNKELVNNTININFSWYFCTKDDQKTWFYAQRVLVIIYWVYSHHAKLMSLTLHNMGVLTNMVTDSVIFRKMPDIRHFLHLYRNFETLSPSTSPLALNLHHENSIVVLNLGHKFVFYFVYIL